MNNWNLSVIYQIEIAQHFNKTNKDIKYYLEFKCIIALYYTYRFGFFVTLK